MTASPQRSIVEGRRLLLGVTGGIAAYKSAELLRLFRKAGADVRVLMTHDAVRFITPLTLGTLSGHEVLIDVFPDNNEGSWTRHVHLGRWADLFVIAPATAQTIAKLAHGFCDNMLTATALSARSPFLICPAMDHDMFLHPSTQRNLEILGSFGYAIMPPEHGELASGLMGEGRLPEPARIFARAVELLREAGGAGGERSAGNFWSGRRVLVTAGPTREHIDPVRFISNPSSGKMGFAIAEAAAARGAEVTLISGPAQLATPAGVERIETTSAADMYQAVMARSDSDLVIMAAAVADYTPAETSPHKEKKAEGDRSILLRRTRDILAELGVRKRSGQILVGFAMETRNGLENAREKLRSKNLDWIVLNQINTEGAGFDVDTNRVTLLGRDSEPEELPLMSKRDVADAVLDRVGAAVAHEPNRA